jgi:hypothetical protein
MTPKVLVVPVAYNEKIKIFPIPSTRRWGVTYEL